MILIATSKKLANQIHILFCGRDKGTRLQSQGFEGEQSHVGVHTSVSQLITRLQAIVFGQQPWERDHN